MDQERESLRLERKKDYISSTTKVFPDEEITKISDKSSLPNGPNFSRQFEVCEEVEDSRDDGDRRMNDSPEDKSTSSRSNFIFYDTNGDIIEFDQGRDEDNVTNNSDDETHSLYGKTLIIDTDPDDTSSPKHKDKTYKYCKDERDTVYEQTKDLISPITVDSKYGRSFENLGQCDEKTVSPLKRKKIKSLMEDQSPAIKAKVEDQMKPNQFDISQIQESTESESHPHEDNLIVKDSTYSPYESHDLKLNEKGKQQERNNDSFQDKLRYGTINAEQLRSLVAAKRQNILRLKNDIGKARLGISNLPHEVVTESKKCLITPTPKKNQRKNDEKFVHGIEAETNGDIHLPQIHHVSDSSIPTIDKSIYNETAMSSLTGNDISMSDWKSDPNIQEESRDEFCAHGETEFQTLTRVRGVFSPMARYSNKIFDKRKHSITAKSLLSENDSITLYSEQEQKRNTDNNEREAADETVTNIDDHRVLIPDDQIFERPK